MTNLNKVVTGLLAGALIGAIAELLFAPKTGKETREIVGAWAGELRHRADEWRDWAGDYIGNLRGKLRRGRGIETIEERSGNGVQTHR
jgi:gas vesicle protein